MPEYAADYLGIQPKHCTGRDGCILSIMLRIETDKEPVDVYMDLPRAQIQQIIDKLEAGMYAGGIV